MIALIDLCRGRDFASPATSGVNHSRGDLLTSGEDTGRLFAAVKPKLAVIYHYKDEQGLADSVRGQYQGPFVIAKDLMVIEIDRETTWNPGTAHVPKNAH